MPRALCTLCHTHPADLPTQLCQACRRQVGRDLTDLPGWYAALLERPRRGSGQRVTGATTTAHYAAGDAALDVRSAIRSTLTAWALHLAAYHRIPAPAAALASSLTEALDDTRTAKFAAIDATSTTAAIAALRDMLTRSRHATELITALDRLTSTDQVTALAEHLTENTDTLLAGDHAALMAAQLGELVDRSTRTAAPDRPDTVPIGRCPACSGTVLADPTTEDAWCTRCGDRGDIRWWQRRLPSPAEWLSPGRLRMHLLLAHDVKVTDAQLWQWVHRGHVRSQGQGRRAVYHVGDALTRAQSVPAPRSAVHTVSEPA